MFASKAQPDVLGKREKPYARKMSPMSRSGSLLGTIKNIVSAPLSWFASNQEDFEDLGKRRRIPSRDAGDFEEQRAGRTGKRMRVDSPERSPVRVQPSGTGGYLDPPLLNTRLTQAGLHRSSEEKDVTSRRSSIFGPPPPSSSDRNMSIDPPSRFSTFKRDPATAPLPSDSPVRSSPARSFAPEDELERPRSPLRLRTSLTPQPSPSRRFRRESSAPPPFSNFQSRATFVRGPGEEKQDQKFIGQKTVPLGALAEASRRSRAAGRDRKLSGLGHKSNTSDQTSPPDAMLQPSKSLSERAFHELELYKTPILPSRYKDASEIPAFLRPKRSHVPVPMSKKGRAPRPSLGMAERYGSDLDVRDDGKQYARKTSARKIMSRRRQEEEEEDRQKKLVDSTLASVREDDEMETDVEPPVAKRDVDISAETPSSSQEERMKASGTANSTADLRPAASTTATDPFQHASISTPGGRQQPYGRVGRSRIREPGQRSVPLSRPANKFSAPGNEDESVTAEDEVMKDVSGASEKAQADVEKSNVPAYEAPKGFSFPSDTSTINHDLSKAKEPPIQSLPFSLGRAGVASTAAMFKPPAFGQPSASFSVSQASAQEGETKKDGATATVQSTAPEPVPQGQPVDEAKKTQVPSSFFAAPSEGAKSGSLEASSATSKPLGIPNFFATSPLLAGDKPATSVPKVPSPASLNAAASSATPTTPVKDPENPLWDGNKTASSAPPKLFAGAVKPFEFGPKPAEGPGASGHLAVPSPLFGAPPKPPVPASSEPQPSAASSGGAAFGVTPSLGAQVSQAQPVSAKQPEPEKKTNGSAPPAFFSFGAGAASNVPKPLFGTGSPTGSIFSGQPAQTTSGESAPTPAFTFGQPQASGTASKTPTPPSAQPMQNAPTTTSTQPAQNAPTTTSTQPAQNAPPVTEPKPPFTFGAPSVSNAAGSTPTSGGTDAVAAPKPLFGAQSAGTGFTFASPAPPAAPSAEAAKPASPFAFGAPPATPPAGDRQGSPFAFGGPAPAPASSTGFTFGTPVKENGAVPGSNPSTPTNASPFMFGAQQPPRPVTPPSRLDEGMSMEESPVQMDTNNGQKKPSITFGSGPTPVNPFGQNAGTGPAFAFGAGLGSNLFAKDNSKLPEGGGFNFNRTASAPAISTSFSFGAKPDQPPASATGFSAPSNPFTQTQTSGASTTPFTFGQQTSAPIANPFSSSSQSAPAQTSQAPPGPTPNSPFSSTPTFTFGAPTASTSNAFTFGASAPSSPASGSTGLPQPSGTTGSTPAFTFGQSSGTGGSLFNIGAPPPNTAQTPTRQIKKLPRRANLRR